MKHSLKISSFIIFAAIVASVFTSCGNDSELFDEPVMFQTRAMARASMRIEREEGRYITTNGPSIGIYPIREGEAQLEVTFYWKSGFEHNGCYTVDPYPVFIDKNPHNEGSLYAYIYEETEKPYISKGPYTVRENFDEYLVVEIKGTIYEYRYNRSLGEFDDTTRYYIDNHQCIAQNGLGIEDRYNTSHNTLSKPIINNPIKLSINDSITNQNQ